MIYRALKRVIKFLVPSYFHSYLERKYNNWLSYRPFLYSQFSPNSYYYRGLYDNLNRKKNVYKKILGVWDFNHESGSIGDAIVFQEILNVLRCMHGLAKGEDQNIDICYIDDSEHPNTEKPSYAKTYEWKQMMKSTHRANPYVGSVYEFSTNADFDQFIARYKDEYLMWPGEDIAYDRRIIHHFFKKHKFIPRLSCHPEIVNWALDFVENHAYPSLPIVVQIRKNIRQPERDTNIKALYDFLHSYQASNLYKFIVICHQDEIDEDLEKLDNVIFAKRYNTDLEKDLALIQTAYACIFPTSGVFSFATFTGVPYVQFDVKVMTNLPFKAISKKSPYFNFNAEYQRMFLEKENFHLLKTEFERLMKDLEKAGWQNPEQKKPVPKVQSTF